MSGAVHQHPVYHTGFYAALDGAPCPDHCPTEFRAGWCAATTTMKLFDDAGFRRSGRAFRAVHHRGTPQEGRP